MVRWSMRASLAAVIAVLLDDLTDLGPKLHVIGAIRWNLNVVICEANEFLTFDQGGKDKNTWDF